MTERYSGITRLLISYAPIMVSLVFVWNWAQIADDALITHRYVENFLTNGEPYFNSGDRALGLTSPGYFLMLSGISTVIPIAIAYKLIAAIAYLLAGVALVHLFPSQKLSHRLIASVIFAANLHMAYWFFSGLETFFIPLAAVGSLLAIRKGSAALLILSVGLVVIFRPEAWVAVLPLTAVGIYFTRHFDQNHRLRMNRRTAIASITSLALVLGSVSIFIVSKYDNFVPLSLIAKATNNSTLGIDSIAYFSAGSIAPVNLPVPFGYVPGFLIITLAVVFTLWKPATNDLAVTQRSFAAGMVVFGLYLLFSGAWVWGWHFIFVSYAVTVFLASISIRFFERPTAWQVLPVVVLIALMLWSGLDFGNARNERINSFYIAQMQAAAEFVDDRYPDGTVVVVGSSGYFGQSTPDKYVHDSAGLFTPEQVKAKQNDITTHITDVIPWDVFVCHKDKILSDPVSTCLSANLYGRLVGNFGDLWIIENAE
jgi:hypothetical protein